MKWGDCKMCLVRLTKVILGVLVLSVSSMFVYADQAQLQTPQVDDGSAKVEDLSQPASAAQTSQVESSPTISARPVDTSTLSSDISAQSPQANLPTDQRLTRVEQQINNLIKMNMPQQIADLQQQIQQLSGQLQVQAHDLKLLNDQQRSFYQDLDQRINQLKNLSADNSVSDSSATVSSSSDSTDIKVKDAKAYQDAFKLITDKKYPQAITALQSYTSDYPNGQFVANAHYWSGEVYLLDKQYGKAQDEFNTVISKYSTSAKVKDAKLKLAIVHMAQGKSAVAKAELLKLKKQYPNSAVAKLADLELKQIEATSAPKPSAAQQ